MWTKIHTTQPGKPLRRSPRTLTMALKRPMAAALPRSRYLKGTLSRPFSRRLIVLAACRPPCMATSQTPGRLLRVAMSPTANTSGCPGRLRSGQHGDAPGAVGRRPRWPRPACRPAGRPGRRPPKWWCRTRTAPSRRPRSRCRPRTRSTPTTRSPMRSSTPIFPNSLAGPPGELGPPKLARGSLPPSTRMTRTVGRVDVPEVLGQAPVGELADLTRQLHTGRPGARRWRRSSRTAVELRPSDVSASSSAP